MRVVVAMDSFKGCLTSLEAGEAVAAGVLRAVPEAEVLVRPLADGGEGTMDTLTRYMGGRKVSVEVEGPYRERVNCVYGILEERRLAIIEVAGAVGLQILKYDSPWNPLQASTYGVGEVILDAIKRGCRTFLIGLGGSATNDAGAGMLQALGAELLNAAGEQIPRGAAALRQLVTISVEGLRKTIAGCEFYAICDVKNPLLGLQGCSRVFSMQKGAARIQARKMDAWLTRFAEQTREVLPESNPDAPGAGAAGGLGYAFQSYLKGKMEPGARLVLEATGFRELLPEAELVLTGEGSLDAQTAMGKAVCGVTEDARICGVPSVVLAGQVSEDMRAEHVGATAIFQIPRGLPTLLKAKDPIQTRWNLEVTAEQVTRLFFATRIPQRRHLL